MSNAPENLFYCNGLLVSTKAGAATVNGERVDFFYPRCYAQPQLNQDGNFIIVESSNPELIHSNLDLTQADLGLYFSAGFALILSVWLATKGIVMVVNFVKNL